MGRVEVTTRISTPTILPIKGFCFSVELFHRLLANLAVPSLRASSWTEPTYALASQFQVLPCTSPINIQLLSYFVILIRNIPSFELVSWSEHESLIIQLCTDTPFLISNSLLTARYLPSRSI